MFNKLRNFVYTSKQKAVVAFIGGAIGTYLVQNGLTIKDVLSWHGLQALVVGVVTHQLVYWTSNREG